MNFIGLVNWSIIDLQCCVNLYLLYIKVTQLYTHRHSYIYIFIYVKSKIWHKLTYLQNITDIENRLVVTKGEESRGGKDWEYGISGCKLSCQYIGWTNNRSCCMAQGTIFNGFCSDSCRPTYNVALLSQCGPWIGSITWELVRNTKSWASAGPAESESTFKTV